MLRSPLTPVWATLAGGMMLCASGAMADVLTVYPDGSGDYTAIQDAIDASANGDTILIGPGAYNESLDTGGRSLTLRGINGYPQTILDSAGGTATLLDVNGGEASLLVEGISFRNGQNASMTVIDGSLAANFVSCRWLGGTASEGAGIRMTNATVNFADCQWISNQVTSWGGAIDATSCTLTFENGKFISNQNTGPNGAGSNGGAIHATDCDIAFEGGEFSENSTTERGGALWINDCTLNLAGTSFTSNQCGAGTDDARGGAIYLESSSGNWADCDFNGNRADSSTNASGGDVYLLGSSPVITGCTFTGSEANTYRNTTGNFTVYSVGGSFCLGGGSSPVFLNAVFESCLVRSNAANSIGNSQNLFNSRADGGAIWCEAGAHASFNNCHFDNCDAFATGTGGGSAGLYGRVSTSAYGGAIFANNASPLLTNSDFNNCSATRSSSGYTHGTNIAYGGSIYLENLASPTILGSTFAGSSSQYGAVIYAASQSAPFISQSTFSGNTSSDRAGVVYSNDASPVFAACLFQSNTAPNGSVFYTGGSAGYFPQVGSSTFCGNGPGEFVGDYFDDGGNVFIAECGDDCNGNGISDLYEIEIGVEADCDGDGVLDSCEIGSEPGLDCDGDGTLDSCQFGGGDDCDGDGVPDDCEADCDGDGTPDDCQILKGAGTDCDGDGTLDACQIDADPSLDCNDDGVLDICVGDANNDGILDDCQGLDFTGVEIEIAPITGVIRDDASLMPLAAVCYRIYATFDDPGAQLIGLYGSPETGSMIFITNDGLYQDSEGGDLASQRPCDPKGFFPELAFDSFLTVGGDCASDSFEQAVGMDFTGFNATGSMIETDGIVLVEPDDLQGAPDGSGRVLVAQLTSLDGAVPEGRFNLIGTNADGSDFQAFQMTWGEPVLVDCNGNGVQDARDIGVASSRDCNLDGIPDECQTDDPDRDCNGNGTPDWCDISSGVSVDANDNGIPDECECEGDLNGDGLTNVDDIIIVILNWGEIGENPGDANNDGIVDGQDLGLVITSFGGCG